jgi:HEAT repeat protein
MPFPRITIPPIDGFSFWAGFAAATLIFVLLYRFRRELGLARQAFSDLLWRIRETLTAGTERNLRDDLLQLAQTMHLAGSVFALDEILLPPRLIVPDPGFDPTAPKTDEDLNVIIPVIPEWPDLAGIYRAPALSVEQAFGGGENLLILGGPGHGKTTLLAHLTARAAHGDEALFPDRPTPLFIHAADLTLPREEEDDVSQPLIAAMHSRVSALTAARLPRHLRQRLQNFKCVIFIDGFDQMPPAQIAEVAEWLREFKEAYPTHRIIAVGGLWGYGPLLQLGLAPVHIAPWNAEDYRNLIGKWGAKWEEVIRARKKKSAPTDADPQMIMGWLGNGNQGRTIYEVTLKIWAAFVGDARGNRPVDWLEAYILRHKVKPAGHQALGKIAVAMLAQDNYLGAPRADLAVLCDAALLGPTGKPEVDSDDFLDDLISRGLLSKHAKDRISFRHDLTAAYCAAMALATTPEAAPANISSTWARGLYFFASLGDLTPLVARNLSNAGDIVQTELLNCALWLRDAPANARWRNEVFKRLAQLMLDSKLPENLRLRALAGFVTANDPAVAALFKQALGSSDPFSRRLAILGLGAIREATAVQQIAPLIADPYLDVRWAAALALAAIGTQQAIDSLARGLLEGDDAMRQACAQALVLQPEEGHALLQEAIKDPNVSVRRAAVYGLAAIQANWATKILEDVRMNEKQWIVRTAATEILERREGPLTRSPKPYTPPDAQGWLVAWAATKQVGVPPGKAAIEVLNRALKEGDEPTRRAAAEALGRLGDPAVARELYTALRDPAPLLRDAAFRALSQVSTASGQKLALPVGSGQLSPK